MTVRRGENGTSSRRFVITIGVPASARLPVVPAAQANTTAGAESAAGARQGSGVDARDLPAMLRVAMLPEEAVDRAKMEFPGTYNRKGQLIEDPVEAIEGEEQGASSGDGGADSSGAGDDVLALLEDEFPYLLGS